MTKKEIDPNTIARIAGILYLLLAVFGAFSILYVRGALIVPSDAVTTASNILASEGLYRIGIASGLIYLLIFILLGLALYKLLKVVNRNQAVLMVILVLVSVPIAMLNELNQIAALAIVKDSGFLTAFTTEQTNTFLSFFLDLHASGIMIAQIFWGLWLFPLGYLVFKSGFIPKVIGILLMIGCFGYLIDSFTFFLLPNFGVTFSEFTFIGEILLPLWLIIRGVNVKQWENASLSLQDFQTHQSI